MILKAITGQWGGGRRQAQAADDTPLFPVETVELSPYLMVADRGLGVVSIFDDLKYDRSDADMLSPGMRRHAVEILAGYGFRQTSGAVLTHGSGRRCHFPKAHALGASPFDILRYVDRAPGDLCLLTPTQTACQIIDTCDHAQAVERIRTLIQSQPINLLRLMDYLEDSPAHRAFHGAIGHLKYVQREAIARAPLRSRRALS